MVQCKYGWAIGHRCSMVKLGMVVQDLKISIDIQQGYPTYLGNPSAAGSVLIQGTFSSWWSKLLHCVRMFCTAWNTAPEQVIAGLQQVRIVHWNSADRNYQQPQSLPFTVLEKIWKAREIYGATVVHLFQHGHTVWALGRPDNAARVTGSPPTARWNLPDLSRSSTPGGESWGQLTDLSMFKDASSVSL